MLKDELNKEIFQHAIVSRKKVNGLAKKYCLAQNSDEKLAYRDELFLNVSRFIKKVILESPAISRDEVDDVFSEAVLNYYYCLDLYDPAKSGFVSYLFYWIRKSIIDYCYKRNIINIKRGAFGKNSKTLVQANMAKNSSLINMDWTPESTNEEDAINFHNTISSGQDIEGDVYNSINHEQLVNLVKQTLDPKEFLVIKYRYLTQESWTLKDLSSIFHITRENVRVIEYRALHKLRKMFTNKQDLRFPAINYRDSRVPLESDFEEYRKNNVQKVTK